MARDQKNRFKTRASAIAVASCLAVLPTVANAAGLGRLTVLSMLGQPLRAEIELTATQEEIAGMTAKVASADAFKLAGVDYAGTLTALKFSIEERPDGRPFVRLASDRPINDPFVDMLVELSWPAGRLVREYTFLLDPPEMTIGGEPIVAPVDAPTRDVASEPVPAPDPEVVVPTPPLAADAGQRIEPAYGAGPGEIDIKRGDTLSGIANRIRGEGVSLEQMLVALFRDNPGAFMGKNMNRMMAGKILTVPSIDAAAAISQEDAVREVRAQAADWNAYRRRLAGVVAEAPAQEAEVKQEVAGKIEAKVDEQAPVVKPGQDQVKIAKTETPADGAPVAGAIKAEDKIAEQRALKESEARTAELEKNVADLQKLIEIKSQGMSQAQQQAEAAKTPETAKADATKPVEADKPAEAAPAAKVEAATPPATATGPAEAGQQAAPAAAAQEAPKPKPRPRIPPPPPPEEPSIFEELMPAILGGVLAILAGVGGFLFIRRRRKAAGSGPTSAVLATGTLSQPSLGGNSVFRATGGQSVDTSNVTPATTDFSQAGPGTIDTDEVDPVAEAEVYMAYGRDAQAEEILLEALQKDPKRTAIHGKLLEIYANRKSLKQFETLATELFAQTGGEGPDWEAAAALGAKLDPANALYTGGAGSAPAAPAVPAAADAKPKATSTVTMPGELSQIAAAAEAGGGVDFDLGGAGAQEPEKQIFDFDLGLGGDSSDASKAQQSTMVLPEETSAAKPEGGAASDTSFDFNLGGGAEETPVDFELMSSQIAPEPIVPEKPAVDVSKISLDLETPAAESDFDKTMLFTPGSMPEASPEEPEVDSESVGMDTTVQAVATKLDLAKAYQEMGDAEGARELLDEVMAEGTAQQKKAAQEILGQLA